VTEAFSFDVASLGKTTALVYRAREPLGSTLLFTHGAGASQLHPFMTGMARRIASRGVDVVTFNFLYTEHGRRMPDRTDVLEACWRAAIASVRARGATARLFCGGKSMGGRIASQVAAAGGGLSLSGLVFLGYPLHASGKRKPRLRRDEHLGRVPFPMLFVQGSRDELGTAEEMRAVVRKLEKASLHVVAGGDHSLSLRKRDGDGDAALEVVADKVVAFTRKHARRA
jgi:predicted alpha/beta-hydrolase family hydrolase